MARPEATLQAKIVAALEQRGAYGHKAHQSGWGRRGTPDLSYCYRGHALILEVKPPGGTPTDQQLVNLANARKAGAIAAIVTSVDTVIGLLDQVDALIDHDRHTDGYGRFRPMGQRVIAGHIPSARIVELDSAA